MLLLMCNNVLNLLCNYVLKTQKRDLNTMSISCSFTNTIAWSRDGKSAVDPESGKMSLMICNKCWGCC